MSVERCSTGKSVHSRTWVPLTSSRRSFQNGQSTVRFSASPFSDQRWIQNGKTRRRCASFVSRIMTIGHGALILRYSGSLPRPCETVNSGGSRSHASSSWRSTRPTSGQSIQSRPGLIPSWRACVQSGQRTNRASSLPSTFVRPQNGITRQASRPGPVWRCTSGQSTLHVWQSLRSQVAQRGKSVKEMRSQYISRIVPYSGKSAA